MFVQLGIYSRKICNRNFVFSDILDEKGKAASNSFDLAVAVLTVWLFKLHMLRFSHWNRRSIFSEFKIFAHIKSWTSGILRIYSRTAELFNKVSEIWFNCVKVLDDLHRIYIIHHIYFNFKDFSCIWFFILFFTHCVLFWLF